MRAPLGSGISRYVANEIFSSLKNIYKRIYITGTTNSVFFSPFSFSSYFDGVRNTNETVKNRAVHSDTIIERGLCSFGWMLYDFFFRFFLFFFFFLFIYHRLNFASDTPLLSSLFWRKSFFRLLVSS